MTIKEMEEFCAMSRANIRFYEAEGLIKPKRRENGYREYSQEDARLLMKVKLLRSMDVPLDQVKAAAFGERRLKDVLEDLDRDLKRKAEHQERTRQALEKLGQEEAEFGDLVPEEYLTMLEEGEPVEDAPPRLNLPWRRYWARGLDWSLYGTLVSIFLTGFRNRVIYVPLFTFFVMLFGEPMLLHLFGTTLGKAVFGIRVTDREGRRLDYNTALERTWTVLWEGEALRFPVIGWYFQYKSLNMAEQELPLAWENESELIFADDKNWRYLLLLAAHGAILAAEYFLMGG